MRILIHAHEFNIKEGGPCTKRMNSFAEYFSKKGHDVVVLASSHNKYNELDNINNNYKIVYSYTTKQIKGSTLKRLVNNLLFGITSFFKSMFKVGKIDVVITTSPPPLISIFGYMIAKIKKAKLIYDVRDIWPDVALEMESFTKDSLFYKVFSKIAKFMYKKSDYITTVSPGKVEKIKSYSNDEKVWYIPNGFDDNFLKFEIDNKCIAKYDLDKKFTVVYIGNVGLAQNLDAMVELAKDNISNKEIQFLIFGDGAYKEELSKKITELELNNILVLGKIDYSKVFTILTNSKISFISLKNNNMTDSIPTKMFDALGVGCPVLLMAKGDSVNILNEVELGESAESVDELKDKFKQMVKNYDLYADKKQKCIEHIIKEYSREAIAEKLENKLEEHVK